MRGLGYLAALFGKGTKRMASRSPERQMSLVGHIIELRGHLLRAVLWVAFFTILAFTFMDELLEFLRMPYVNYQKDHGLADGKLMTTGVFEVVTLNLKICLIAAFVASVPFIVRELWKFVSPALYDHERKIALPVTVASVLMFYLGLAFGFFIIIPAFLNNTLEWASRYANVVLTVDNYFSSISMLAVLFGIVFEVPVVLSLLGIAGIIRSDMIAKNRRIVILVSFIVGALISPPDVFSQTVVSVPLYLMCELSVISLRLIEKNRAKMQAELGADASDTRNEGLGI